MEIHQRKIQKFAKYSYAVTIPIHWIKKNQLEPSRNGEDVEKESIINIFEQADGSLALYPHTQQQTTMDKVFIFELDEALKQNPNFLDERGIQLLLINYYMNGASSVEIISKNPIKKELIDQIEKTQSRLLFNWNLNRVSNHKLLIKNVFTETPENIFQEDIPRYLRECFSIILWMLEDIYTAILEKNYDKLPAIGGQDDKIDRYYFFIVRQIRTIFENPQISKPLNYSHKKLIDLRLLAKLIEDVGDSLKNIADTLYQLHSFLEEISLHDFLRDYFKCLIDEFNILSDLLRKSVGERVPSIGMNAQVMSLIQKFRNDGKVLETKWLALGPNLSIVPNNHTFMQYYQGARLIGELEDIFKNIFDFTNIFF